MLLIVLAEATLRWNFAFWNNFFTKFWHFGDKSDFLPILPKMQNITIIYERNDCQLRLKYTWLREIFLQVRYLTYTVLWMIRGLVSQIDPKKELKFWTILIIVLLKEQSTVYIHGKLLRPSQWYIRKGKQLFTNFWHSGDKSDYLPILQKMQNITIIYERNACQIRLVHVGGFLRFPPPIKLTPRYNWNIVESGIKPFSQPRVL
jgi:hypothetical protein